MQKLCYLAFTFMCSASFLSPVLSVQCSETQYAWPVDTPQLCCNKCPPGEHMVRRADSSCKIECEPCTGKRYTDNYNVEMSCSLCDYCSEENMEDKSHCNATHNTVCGCKAGYRCKDQPCTECVEVPEPAPSTTAFPTITTMWIPRKPVTDNAWFLVIVALMCIVIASIVITKIKPFLRWIRAKFAEKPAPVPTCSKDEEVSTPIQEVCGKCDQLIDV